MSEKQPTVEGLAALLNDVKNSSGRIACYFRMKPGDPPPTLYDPRFVGLRVPDGFNGVTVETCEELPRESDGLNASMQMV